AALAPDLQVRVRRQHQGPLLDEALIGDDELLQVGTARLVAQLGDRAHRVTSRPSLQDNDSPGGRIPGTCVRNPVRRAYRAPGPLPVAAPPAPMQPPPVPRDARPSVDEERQWEELINQAKTDGSAARAPAGDDDWSRVIASAKRQAATRAGGVGDEWGAAIA